MQSSALKMSHLQIKENALQAFHERHQKMLQSISS